MILSDADQRILVAARRDYGQFHMATDWYFGWLPQDYQYAYHHIPQKNTTFLAGIASGKTFIQAGSVAIDCLTTPYFRALSTSVTAKQAELGFQMFLSWMSGNSRLEKLIKDIKLRPWPIIFFQNFSEWEFRTAGTDASLIRGFEYDRAGYDEAGLDYAGETVKVLRGRLRGRRPDGQTRMARLDVFTSPTDAPWLRERFDLGWEKSDNPNMRLYKSMRIRTEDNRALTKEQIELMENEYTPEMKAVEMDAMFPDYGMSMFPKSHINACTDTMLYDLIYLALNPEDEKAQPKPDFVLEEHPRYGIVRYEVPFDPGGQYVMAGDPGTDDPPRRNAASVGVLRTDVNPKKLVYFDWVFGHGSYMPFLRSYKYAISKYNPFMRGIDTTSTQKGIQELAFDEVGISTDGINFSHDKDAALNSLSLDITGHALAWAPASGLIKQVSSYTRELDKKKAPQDIVMMLAMLSLMARYAPGELGSDQPVSTAPRWNRKVRARTRRR